MEDGGPQLLSLICEGHIFQAGAAFGSALPEMSIRLTHLSAGCTTIQAANSYGNGEDKKSFADRHLFAVNNLDRIIACATNPLSDGPVGRCVAEA